VASVWSRGTVRRCGGSLVAGRHHAVSLRLQHRHVRCPRLRRSADHRRRVQPATGRDARRSQTQLVDAELVAEARAARDATSGRDRARVRRLRVGLTARIRPRRGLRLAAGGRRAPPALAGDLHGDRKLSGRVQCRRQLSADAVLRAQVPPDVVRRTSLSEAVVDPSAGVDDDGAGTTALPIDRRLARDNLLTL